MTARSIIPSPGDVPGLATVWISEPPFRGFRERRTDGRSVTEGAVLAFGIATRELDADICAALDALAGVRRARPASLLVACLDDPDGLRSVTLARHLARMGVRITLVGEPSVAAVRRALARAGAVDVDIAAWLRLRLRAGGPTELGTCLAVATDVAGEALEGVRSRELERALRILGLPSLRRWRMLRAVLPGVLRLQVERSLTVNQVVRASPYRTRRGYDRTCSVLTGLSASRLGRRLGWEFVLARMLERANEGFGREGGA